MSSMKQIDQSSVVDEPVGSEGGRSPSPLPTGQAPPGLAASPPAGLEPKVGPLAPGQRWSVARKREVVLRLLRGESADAAWGVYSLTYQNENGESQSLVDYISCEAIPGQDAVLIVLLSSAPQVSHTSGRSLALPANTAVWIAED